MLLIFSFLGCESKGPYKIEEDKMILDLSKEVQFLEGELKKMKEDMEKAEKVGKEPDLDTELRESIQRELFEAYHWENKIFEQMAYFKLKMKRRKKSLIDRKNRGVDLHKVATKEVEEYFLHKKLYPLQKGWENRHKAAIDL